jgi:hypothetical protein
MVKVCGRRPYEVSRSIEPLFPYTSQQKYLETTQIHKRNKTFTLQLFITQRAETSSQSIHNLSLRGTPLPTSLDNPNPNPNPPPLLQAQGNMLEKEARRIER